MSGLPFPASRLCPQAARYDQLVKTDRDPSPVIPSLVDEPPHKSPDSFLNRHTRSSFALIPLFARTSRLIIRLITLFDSWQFVFCRPKSGKSAAVF